MPLYVGAEAEVGDVAAAPAAAADVVARDLQAQPPGRVEQQVCQVVAQGVRVPPGHVREPAQGGPPALECLLHLACAAQRAEGASLVCTRQWLVECAPSKELMC